MTKLLKTQLENSDEIRDVLRKINISFTVEEQPVETLLVYLPCKKGVCDHSDIFRLIKQNILTNFVLSCSEIERKLSISREKAPEKLFEKAVRKLSKHTAQGELGELLLFTLLDVYFKAPKILSKISLKTNRKMPVFGADAVHAQYKNGALRLYLGESKLHKKFPSAATAAAKSISTALEKYEEDFDVIDSHIDFPEMEDEVRCELLELLDPFDENNDSIPDILHSPCFIGFAKPSVFADDEEVYKQQYIALAKEYIGSFYTKLVKEGNKIEKTALILLPFSSLNDLVNEFISYMGIKK